MVKNSWFYKILEKFKKEIENKNLPQRKIWVGRTHKTGLSFPPPPPFRGFIYHNFLLQFDYAAVDLLIHHVIFNFQTIITESLITTTIVLSNIGLEYGLNTNI